MESGEIKSRIGYITHRGRRILHIDHTPLEAVPSTEQAREFFARAHQEVASQPPGSVRLLTSMSPRVRFNTDLAALEREFARANTPYMKKSAVVGATAAVQAIIATLCFFTGREIKTFATTAEALDWLAG